MAEWIIVVLTALSLLGALIMALVKVATAIAGLSQATESLKELLKEHGGQLDDHEGRLTTIETIHQVRGCSEADA